MFIEDMSTSACRKIDDWITFVNRCQFWQRFTKI